MCGIVGMCSQREPVNMTVLNAMRDTMIHRGPDDAGSWCSSDESTGLAHRRLSIIDLSPGARQPLSNHIGDVRISFNGEIYNYRELRRELEGLGYAFRTSSDTEVILAAYGAWGAGCLDRFRGMFAFVIMDDRRRELFAARDLFGEKPLYFAETPDGTFLVASEIKAILASQLIEPRLDLTAIDAFLTFGYVPPDRTVYANIGTLPPGHFLIWHDGKVRTTRYWEPRLDTSPVGLADAAAHLRELIEQAVVRQMVSDVPVGAFLSGGLDSSTIVALMQRHSTRPVMTFSVGFGRWINELPFARAVAECYGTDHHEVDLGTPAVAPLLERMAEVYDEPFADTSNIPTFLISEFARKHVKVVLSGDGGDELFGGYSWYLPLMKAEGLHSSYAEWIALRILSKLLRDRHAGLRIRSVAAGLSVRGSDAWTRRMMSSSHFNRRERRVLWSDRVDEVEPYSPGIIIQPPEATAGLNRGFYHDLTAYLPGDILVKVDRAAMANSLETRAPFLDRDVAEFALSLPAALKVRKDETKVVLREACIELWPESLRKRGKQGFGVPVGEWLDMPDVRELARRVFVRGSRLRMLLPGIDERQANGRAYKNWILLTLGLWLELHGVDA